MIKSEPCISEQRIDNQFGSEAHWRKIKFDLLLLFHTKVSLNG